MSDIQYRQYVHLHTFAIKWRKYVEVDKLQTKEVFRKQMQSQDYVKMIYAHKSGKPIHIYLMSVTSKYSESSQYIKRMLGKIRTFTDIIIVTKNPFNVYAKRAIALFKHLRIKTYLHSHFNLIAPNGPLCYPHRIMSIDEVNHLLNNELYCKLSNLPKILISDVQCIWIGAELGDVIEIRIVSDITGETIHYRVVTAPIGKSITFRDEAKKMSEDE